MTNRYKLLSGDSISAIEMQQQLMAAAKRLASQSSISLPEEELWTIEQWDKACADMTQDPALLKDRVDWVVKKQVLERKQEKLGCSWQDKYLQTYERLWDLIDDNKGIGIRLRQNQFSKWMPPESLIEQRMSQAPTTTRAHLRHQFINAFSRNTDASVNWDFVKYDQETLKLDQYCTQDPRVDRLIKSNRPSKSSESAA